MSSSLLAHVHETTEAVATLEMTPPHPPRVSTPEYARAHKFLINQKNAPCVRCGVTKRSLKNTAKNPFGATQLETHHYPIARSLMDACDPVKVHRDFPQVYDRLTLAAFVDSPANLIVLCDVHHRSVEHGIHHQLVQDWAVGPYLLDGYIVATTAKDAAQVEAMDERLVDAALATPGTPGATTAPAPAGERSSPSAGNSPVSVAQKPSRGVSTRARSTRRHPSPQ